MLDRYAEIRAAHRWSVPADFNITQACCTRWAADEGAQHDRDAPARGRRALVWEDVSGERAEYTFGELQREANRLSNALAALRVGRGDRVAIVLPQRPQTAIAHFAAYQLGAITVPLSVLFGPDDLLQRLGSSGARVAFADAQSLPHLEAVRGRLPALEHVIGVGLNGPLRRGVLAYAELIGIESSAFSAVPTRATDPATLIFTSGTTGPPKGALMPHQCVLGNLPGFVCSHDGYPQPGDFFWSPADWAWTGGLMDALLPVLYFGQPILGYRGRFEPERAFALMAQYRIRNTFLFPTALKRMMKAYPRPRDHFDLDLRTLMSAGEPVGTAVFEWAREALGVTLNEMFGQTEMNYIVGNSRGLWPAKPGAMGRPYPGHRVAVIDAAGQEMAVNDVGEVAVHRLGTDGQADPVFFLEYYNNADATREKYVGDWCRTGDLARRDEDGDLWYQGRTDDVFKAAGYRIGPADIENCLVRHPAVVNAAVVPSPDPIRGHVVKAFIVLAAGHAPTAALQEALQAHVRAHLAPYECPREIEFIDELPMTTTGKVQRRVLRDRERARKAAQAAED